jgi:hypothetical protein
VLDPAQNWFPHIDCFAHLVPRNLPWQKKFDFLTEAAQKENPMSYAAREKLRRNCLFNEQLGTIP